MLTLIQDAALGRAYRVPEPVAPAFGRAFDEAAQHRGPATEEELHAATISLVRRLKADGLAPERVVIAVKAALTKYGNMHAPPSLAVEPDDADGARRAAIYGRVFAWCLDEYFN